VEVGSGSKISTLFLSWHNPVYGYVHVGF